jgi:hypothetical protein
MKSTDSDKKGWASPYRPSPKLPKQRPDEHNGHHVKEARVATEGRRGRR